MLEYEKILAEISAERAVTVRMRYDGGKGVAVFYMDAKIEGKGLTAGQKTEKIKLNVEALKEAWNRFEKYEDGRIK